ncbi:MAG TPA: lysophospholipid acyltransferase family protein [Xanthomonadales bacterium]|nr:lysophospholipid acyltransferase family protein [Xanthomonadales bacterium]
MFETLARGAMLTAAHLLTGARGVTTAPLPTAPCVYFGNHVSHGDFALIWAVLPPAVRARTRPVAGADYWEKGPLRRYVGRKVVRAVLIEREREKRSEDPVAQMSKVLDGGESLILFPEGTRNQTDATLLPFKSGLYHLGKAHRDLPLVPAWIDNLHRVLPKGEVIPIPLLCTVHFGAPLTVTAGEDKDAFLERARVALLAQRPAHIVEAS